MTGRAFRESHPHQRDTSDSLLFPFALSGARRVVGVHVRDVGAHLPQADDQGFDLFRRKGRQQPFFARKRRSNNAIMESVAGSGQPHDPRAVVVGIWLTRNKPLVLKHVQAPADRALIKSDRINDLVGADVRHSRENAHHTPFGDPKTEVIPVGVGSTARQPVRDVSEKVRDVPIQIEHGAAGYGCSSLTDVFLLHEYLPRNFSKEIRSLA